jgi:hypothetical protein
VANAVTWSNGVITDGTVWPADCPASPPGVGGVPLIATAIAPVGGPYDGVCMRLTAPVPGVHNPFVLVSPPACPTSGTILGAAVLQVWDDFTTKCANAGDVIKVQFFGPPGLIGPCPGCATWLGSAVIGDVTITAASSVVGGIAQEPELATLPAAERSRGTGLDHAWYFGGGGAAVLLLAGIAGGWYIRRRRSA